MLSNIRALTIDLDDTLWDVAPVIRRAERKLGDWLRQHYPRIPQRFAPADMMALREEVAAANPDQSHDFRFLRRAVMQEMARRVDYPESLADEAFDVFDRHRNEVEFFADVRPALEHLAGRYRLVAVTNGNADLHRIGVAHFFHGIVTAVSAGAPKPDRRIFEQAMEHAGSDPGHVLHVGDHPDHDIEGARRAGLLTAWVNRRGETWPQTLLPPHVIVEDFHGLLDLLESD
ncbi:MAG: HAD family hydrolase [Gammaproteobacteria bacterium]|jgi:2-haloalkanoic acid dehalogenase type II